MKWKAVTADIFEKDPRANYFIVATAALLVFGQTVTYDFVWDDFLFIVNNESIRSFSSIPSFFTHGSEELYRPLRSVFFSLAYFLFGLNPAPYHVMGLVFHIIASILVMRILEYCGFKPKQVLFGGLVFALHPVHIQKFAMATPGFDLAGDLVFSEQPFHIWASAGGIPGEGWVFQSSCLRWGFFFRKPSPLSPSSL
jgi:hypothetical protein